MICDHGYIYIFRLFRLQFVVYRFLLCIPIVYAIAIYSDLIAIDYESCLIVSDYVSSVHSASLCMA